jgi:shikimate dehydrogenase
MKRAAIIGWPVSHSRSPVIHNYWLRLHGIDGVYERLAVSPDDAPTFFADFAASGLVGGNVTLPLKELAAAAAAYREPIVERVGAANTLWLEDGRLHATNTDVPGFLANLDAAVPGWDAQPGPAIVLGAGGAARAVVDALTGRGFAVALCNRTLGRAEALAARYPGTVKPYLLSEANQLAATARVVVNTTSLGMKGVGDIDFDFDRLVPESVVADIVYVPLETAFLRAARARRLRTADGLGMLLHQAGAGFERWFGVRPAVTAELRALVEADL